MGIFSDYEEYFNEYQQKYKKCVVLFQNGAFMEIYGVDNEKEKVGIAREMSTLLNLSLTRRNKAILENNRKNFLMVGFKVEQLDRYVTLLTEMHKYVVVVVEQVSPKPNIVRRVTNTFGPGTNINHLSNDSSNYLVSIYVENEGTKRINKKVQTMTIGISAIDVSTGKNIVHEICNTITDENRAVDEAYRFIQTLKPRELILNIGENIDRETIISQLDISHLLIHKTNIPPEYHKITYQNEFLGKLFKNCGQLSIIEYLDLEKYNIATLSYVILLEFCYQRNETIVNKIFLPAVWKNDQHLILDNNCINQLNLISDTQNGVYDLLNHNSTSMGKRYLRDRLLLPLNNKKQIEQEYDFLELFRKEYFPSKNFTGKRLPGHTKFYKCQEYEIYLKKMCDVERLHRKLIMGWLQPSEFSLLHQTYEKILSLVFLIGRESDPLFESIIPPNFVLNFENYKKFYINAIDIENAARYNNENANCFFRLSYNNEIDDYQETISSSIHFFEQCCKSINNYLSSKMKVVDYKCVTDEYYIEMTPTRFNTFKKKCGTEFNVEDHVINISELEVYNIRLSEVADASDTSKKTTKYRITSKYIKEISDKLINSKKLLKERLLGIYGTFLAETYEKFGSTLHDITRFVTLIDFYKSNAKASLLYNYCRPVIKDCDYSYLKATQLRHPLIEHIQTKIKYVPQDISFEQIRTYFVCGFNGVGKTSLMKALGLAIIMAQTGLYVPAEKFEYQLYSIILTRILGNDNLHKGKSTFVVEMDELRGILKRVNNRSLILGDEICHGTENISGTSIVAKSVIELSKANATCLFATHLHELSKLEKLKSIPTLKFCHLKVECDDEWNLIYDRTLQDGPGSSLYGLEVLKSLGFDKEFIEGANEIRKEILQIENEILPIKKSRYNKRLLINACSIPGCKNKANHTHHIKFQADAGENGYIGNVQKNHVSNLIGLCEPCHSMVHDEGTEYRYIIKGYVMTSDGVKLDFEKIKNT